MSQPASSWTETTIDTEALLKRLSESLIRDGDSKEVKKPPTAFFCFRSWCIEEHKKRYNKEVLQSSYSQAVGMLWEALPKPTKEIFQGVADKVKEKQKELLTQGYKVAPKKSKERKIGKMSEEAQGMDGNQLAVAASSSSSGPSPPIAGPSRTPIPYGGGLNSGVHRRNGPTTSARYRPYPSVQHVSQSAQPAVMTSHLFAPFALPDQRTQRGIPLYIEQQPSTSIPSAPVRSDPWAGSRVLPPSALPPASDINLLNYLQHGLPGPVHFSREKEVSGRPTHLSALRPLGSMDGTWAQESATRESEHAYWSTVVDEGQELVAEDAAFLDGIFNSGSLPDITGHR